MRYTIKDILRIGYFKSKESVIQWMNEEHIEVDEYTTEEMLQYRGEQLLYNFREQVNKCKESYDTRDTTIMNMYLDEFRAFKDYHLDLMTEDQFGEIWNRINRASLQVGK